MNDFRGLDGGEEGGGGAYSAGAISSNSDGFTVFGERFLVPYDVAMLIAKSDARRPKLCVGHRDKWEKPVLKRERESVWNIDARRRLPDRRDGRMAGLCHARIAR